MKDLAGEIFRAGAIPHASGHIRIHNREIVFIQLDKPRRIELRGLDKAAFGRNLISIEATFLCRFATGHWVLSYINFWRAERLRRGVTKTAFITESSGQIGTGTEWLGQFCASGPAPEWRSPGIAQFVPAG